MVADPHDNLNGVIKLEEHQIQPAPEALSQEDREIIAITDKIDFERVEKRLKESQEQFRDDHRIPKDRLMLEVSF